GAAGRAVPIKPFTAKQEIVQQSGVLGDVIGNYKFETAPGALSNEIDKAFVCSGVNYCTRATESAAVDMAQQEVEKALKEQYAYVETFNLDSTMDNMQDGLTDCIASALAELAAQEAQYQMCKTLANFCSNPNYMDPEEEELEEGESFAGGLSLDSVLGDSKSIITDIMCQETEMGQNLQALRNCLQPGNRACRDMIAARIAGNLKQTEIKSVAEEKPIVEIQTPVINFVTKRIQDDPSTAKTVIGVGATGGYNVYTFSVDPAKLIGRQGQKVEEEGEVIFAVHPPGYDFASAIASISSATAGAAFMPFRLPGAIYDWATSSLETVDGNKIQKLIKGFPYVVSADNGKTTSVEFDNFQTTLLTLNKYPIMRAIDNKAREPDNKADAASAARLAANTCTMKGRPVDPLHLFDACEELRTDQNAYDKKLTTEKAPFSRSLVFQAISVNKDNLRPFWPDDYSQATFAVAMPIQYSFTSRGATTKGISPPLVASIPGLGRALYPAKAASDRPELTIPPEDIKRYAVQVTNCMYYRQPSRAINLLPMPNNCKKEQWQISNLFPGSNADKLVVQNLKQNENTCDGGQACVALQLNGKHLAVATVYGLDEKDELAPMVVNTAGSEIGIDELAIELVKYYTDESYNPKKLTRALNENTKCKLTASPTAVLLACGETKKQADSAYSVQAQIDAKFVQHDLGKGVSLKLSGVQVRDANSVPGSPMNAIVEFAPTSTINAIVYHKGEKPTCFSKGDNNCKIADKRDITVNAINPASGVLDLNIGDTGYVLLAILSPDGKSTYKVIGIEKTSAGAKVDFTLTGETGTGQIVFMSNRFASVNAWEFTLGKDKPQQTEPDCRKFATTSGGQCVLGPTSELSFSTSVLNTDWRPIAQVALGLPGNDYNFNFDFGTKFPNTLMLEAQSAIGQLPSSAFAGLLADYSNANLKVTCLADPEGVDDTPWSANFEHGVQLYQSVPGQDKVFSPNRLQLTQRLPRQLRACEAEINTNHGETCRATVTTPASKTFSFVFERGDCISPTAIERTEAVENAATDAANQAKCQNAQATFYLTKDSTDANVFLKVTGLRLAPNDEAYVLDNKLEDAASSKFILVDLYPEYSDVFIPQVQVNVQPTGGSTVCSETVNAWDQTFCSKLTLRQVADRSDGGLNTVLFDNGVPVPASGAGGGVPAHPTRVYVPADLQAYSLGSGGVVSGLTSLPSEAYITYCAGNECEIKCKLP
ncbi:MAG: hypothetical protein V1722_01565, partial [Candidatus Micrarchaeota archaeon]